MAISGLVPIREGTIEFEGKCLANLRSGGAARLGVVHVPEGRRIFAELTVGENLILGAQRHSSPRSRKELLARMYGLFPVLRDRRDLPAGVLSGGEQQMLAIARGLMGLPRLLMVDEPSLGLAPVAVNQAFGLLGAVLSEGTALLLVEQNVERALALASRGYVIENGRIALHGAAVELSQDSRVVGAYLGDSQSGGSDSGSGSPLLRG
jgi:branched-chain amino acid transport system ATP-binding protein